MSFSLDFFSNEKYKLLKIIYDNRVDIKKDAYATLSQQEIADIAHISKLKANRIINVLGLFITITISAANMRFLI